MALSNAERQRRHRKKIKKLQLKLDLALLELNETIKKLKGVQK